MREYFIELSKYGIMICMIIYTISSFVTYFLRKEKTLGFYILQSVFLFLTQAMTFINLMLVSKNQDFLLLYGFIQAFLLAAIVLVPLIYENVNKLLLNNMFMLIGIGLCIVSRLSFNKGVKQYIIALISFTVSLTIPFLLSKFKVLPRLTWLYAMIGIAGLSVVLILGQVTHGSKISFTVFDSITFQPSEFIKIIFLFFLAAALKEKHDIFHVGLTAVIAGAHVIILVLSKDLGSALIFFVSYIFVVVAATGNYLYLLAGISGGAAAAYYAYLTFTHIQSRVMAWQNPWDYIDKEGWAVTQSMFAMGSGSWFGMGLLKGNPKSIPYVDQDFIFSSICEELGVVFGVCLILITLCCFLNICRISAQIKDEFMHLTVFGIGVMYLFQIFLTVGGGMNLIPLTGVTLPFISYGGSSCMTSMFMFFLIQGAAILNVTEKQNKVMKVNRIKQMSLNEINDKSIDSKGAKVKAFFSNFMAGVSGFTNNKKLHIGICSTMFSALFVFMCGYLVYFVVNREQDMVNNSYNSRQEILLSQNYRGSIYSRDGEVLAKTNIDSQQNETRVYPFENLFSHIVGYSTNGRMGVEALANYYLINTNTSINNKVANDIAGIKNPGDNVYTTLDVQIQQTADEQLSIYKGAIIVTEVKTGKILALVSHPDFDPNEIDQMWDSLLEDEESTVLLNRATQGLYPPGSTFKIITALEYIKENPDSYDKYHFQCSGYFKLGDNRINCYHGSNHGAVDFKRSFAKSCNASFANIGVGLDYENFRDTLEKLMFNKPLPLTLNYNQSSIGDFATMSEHDVMQASIGQGTTQITPIHLNMITSAIANDGVLMTPYVIEHVENDAGSIVKSFKPKEYGRLMSDEDAEALKKLMIAVVEEGTAKKLAGQSYTAAGKTGSAEYGLVKGDSHAWFTGFAPAEDPEVAVTIIVEGAGSGGDYAVPIARRLFDAYFREK